mmetsp:Transcript_6370/g.17112  ORF Transcript_6370/g.17112 Transcript_6370/m.17112 type:complete len:339 (-) Transcript_6370:74-1090(-)
MPGDRTWRTALYFLAVPLHDACAAGVVSHHLTAAAGRRHASGTSLLQLSQGQASVHSNGVTPDFFEDSGAAATPSFNPVVSAETAAAVHAVLQQPRAASAPPPDVLAAIASHTSSGAKSSMQLMPTEPAAGTSMFSTMNLKDASTQASRIFSLVAEGARAAARNVAPSWFSAADSTSPPSQAARQVSPTVIVDASRGHKPMKPMAVPQLEPMATAPAAPAAFAAMAVEGREPPASPGAMSFFGSSLRRPEGEPVPAVPEAPMAMLATSPSQAPAVVPAERDPDAMEELHAPQRTQAELEAGNRRAEQLRLAEVAEARELSRQADLEAQMEDTRIGFTR